LIITPAVYHGVERQTSGPLPIGELVIGLIATLSYRLLPDRFSWHWLFPVNIGSGIVVSKG
jgi:hypothetical protein